MPYTIEELMQKRATEGTPVQPDANEIKQVAVGGDQPTSIKQTVRLPLPERKPKNTEPKNESQLMTNAKEYALIALMAIGVLGVAGAVVRLLMWMFGVC